MSGSSFSEQSLEEAYDLYSFAVTSLGAGLSMDVECMTNLPTSTPAEKRAAKTERDMKKAQERAARRQKRIERIQLSLAKKRQSTLERQTRK